MELIGLTGLNASGKGTIADFLKEKGFVYYSLSDIVREEATALGMDHSRESLIFAGNKLRKDFGPSVLAKKIAEKLRQANTSKAVIDSIRNLAEIAELRKLPGFVLIAADAPPEVRFERARSRGRIGFERTLEDFIAVEQKENTSDPDRQQLAACLKAADITVSNEGTVEELKIKLGKLLMTNYGIIL
ncbi:MAG: AAA family ATPase [Candidatus Saganbacteria bacterium]|nr:AAA family ATPase [Candidatus Saganbacteria bacterium]